LKKVPYLLVVGEKEQETNTVAVRRQGEGDQGILSLEDFATKIKTEVEEQLKY